MIFWLLAVPAILGANYAALLITKPGDTSGEAEEDMEEDAEAPSAGGAVEGSSLKGLDKEERVVTVYKAARGAGASHEAALMITAHGALETYWFAHFIDSNLFGLTARKGDPSVMAKDAGDGMLPFRVFSDIQEGIGAYIVHVKTRCPSAWEAVDSEDPGDYATGLKLGKYYSAPLEQFASALKSLYPKVGGIVGEA